MAKTYAQAMDDVRFSPARKAALTKRLTQAALTEYAQAGNGRKARVHSPLQLAAALGIVAVLGGAGVARAATTFVSVEQFAHVMFGGAPATELQGTVGRPLGVVAQSDGVSVSADAVIGDARNVALVFSISKNDGTAFALPAADAQTGLLPLVFDVSDVRIPGSLGMTGGSYFYDADPTDESIQYVAYYNLDAVPGGSVAGGWAHVRLAGLRALGETPDDGMVLASGAWEFDILLNYGDASVVFATGATFNLDGEQARLTRMELSPVALSLEYEASSQAQLDDEPSGQMSAGMAKTLDHYLQLGEVVLEFVDGRELVVPDDGGGHLDAEGPAARAEKSVFLPEIINADKVVAVRVNGTRITR